MDVDISTNPIDEFAQSESNIVQHAIRELSLLKEEPDVVRAYLQILQIFADMGHSGGSASVFIGVLTDLLNKKNLTPLTNDPSEWVYHGVEVWSDEGGIWQNRRNGEAFSRDGGNTYYILSEIDGENHTYHTSVPVPVDED